MEENFSLLESRIFNTIAFTDCEKLFHSLEKIKGNTIFVGAGGSRVVAEFARIVLEKKNHLLGLTCSYRDLCYRDLSFYQNLFIASYSGTNYGVQLCAKLPLKKYLFSSLKEGEFQELLSYHSCLKKEHSFISIGATLIPISLLLLYYDPTFSFSTTFNKEFLLSKPYTSFEVYTGTDTVVAATYLESTMVEGGLGSIILHDKYDYCHGRSTYSKEISTLTIYLINQEKELDRELLSLLSNSKREIVILRGETEDEVRNQYQLLVKSMYLTKQIAILLAKDLSNIDYDKKIVPKIYHFEGEM